MADQDDTRRQPHPDQTIEAERARLFQASAVLKCLYEVLLYADGDEAVTYAEAAHVSKTLIDQSLENLDIVRIGPQIDQLKRAHDYPVPEEGLNSPFPGHEVEDIRAVYAN
jgi:hypothetical protein